MKRPEKRKGPPRKDLLELVPGTVKRVMDVGCADGSFGERLKARGRGVEVVGVERDERNGTVAADKLDRVIVGDVERIDLPFEPGYFDCIIAADVLEHLVDPWAMLARLKTCLKPGGYFITSMPNVRYYKLIRSLLFGDWRYENGGILDRTHLRFFTLGGIRDMFRDAGMGIEGMRRNIISARGLRILNRLLCFQLNEFLTYQYYIVARKRS